MNTDTWKTVQKDIISHFSLENGPAVMREVLEVCRPAISSLVGGDLPEDWIDYCCIWLQHRYFPEQPAPEKEEERSEAVHFFLEVLNGLFRREREELPFDPCRDFQTLI